jgi:hypothetical protein
MEYRQNVKHGSAYDRGAADSYYWRKREPHYYPNGTFNGMRVPEEAMTKQEIADYHEGYSWNELHGDKKDWGYDPVERGDVDEEEL